MLNVVLGRIKAYSRKKKYFFSIFGPVLYFSEIILNNATCENSLWNTGISCMRLLISVHFYSFQPTYSLFLTVDIVTRIIYSHQIKFES